MKTKLLLLFGFLTVSLGFSQQLTVSPNPFTEDEEITITASGLTWDSANSGDVYLWAWHFDADGKQINNPPATGDDFGNSPETAKFTDNGNGTFSYKLKPVDFYNATEITKIGLLAKSKDGKNQTSDFIFNVNTSASDPIPTEAPVPEGMLDGFNYDPAKPSSATFVLFAPAKKFVHLVGNFNSNDWKKHDTYLLNKDSAKNRFWITVNFDENSPKNLEYQYVVENTIRIADPYSTLILDEFNDKDIEPNVYPNIPAYPKNKTSQAISYVQLDEAAYDWKTTDFTPAAKEDLVIYEILVRDFDADHDFKDVMNRLDYLQNLGINAIELMPVQEFDGNLSWGYNPSFHMALDKYYGTRNDLKDLIDECHSRGIAVFLDVVYNHATGQNPYFRMYNTSNGGTDGQPSADSPFFNQEATHSYSVFNDFNHQKSATQEYVRRTTQYWINEFKIDGFRWDLTKGFTQNCTADDQDCTNSYQADRVAVLKRYADYQWAVDSDFDIIFEHLGTNKEEKEWANYRLDEGKGIMLWDNQNYTYNQATIGYDQSDFSGISYKEKGFDNPAAVGYMESHDEERLMYKNEAFGNSSGSYNVKELTTALARMKAAGAFFFTVPGPKMIWQFGELGYDTSIFTCADGTLPKPYGNDECKLSEKPAGWDLLNDTDRVALHDAWKKMIDLKENEPIFSTTDFSLDVSNDNGLKKIQLTDPNANGGAIKFVTVLGNFGVTAQAINPQFQEMGNWFDLIDGSNITVSEKNAVINLAPGEYHIYANEMSTLGSDDTKNPSLFRVYPNPANDFIRFSKQVEYIGLYDLTGKKIRKYSAKELESGRINISQLPAGLYILKAEYQGKSSITKVIIN